MKLTPEQIAQFHEEGWLFLPELFTPEEVALLKREAEAIYAQQRPEVWREKSGAPRTAFAAHLYNEAFRLLGAHPRMIRPVEQILGEPVYMHQYKINAKSAFTGEVWQWHQDYGTWKRDDGMPRAARDEHRGLPRRGDADQRAAAAGAEIAHGRRPGGGT